MNKTKKEAAANTSVDIAELLMRVENDRELIRDLVAIFREDFPKQLELLRAAVEKGEPKQVSACAHPLKGMLANLAAHDASTKAAQLEQLGRDGNIAAMKEAFILLEQAAARLLKELDGFSSGVNG